MLVEEIMNRNVIFIQPKTTIREAMDIIQKNQIRHIPVIEKEKLVGLVTARHLSNSCPTSLSDDQYQKDLNQPVSKIMKQHIITAHPLDFIEDVALTMYENHIGCLPIIQNHKLVGIITESDILRTLIELTGIAHPSSQIEIEVEDRIGVLADVAAIFKASQVNVSSAFVYPVKEQNKKKLVFRVNTMDPRAIIEKIQQAGYQVVWPKF